MFTGIIQAVGRIAASDRQGGDARIHVRTGGLSLDTVRIGDSIAVNGVCLTAVQLPGDGFRADVSAETLACTTVGDLRAGDPVNLETALTPQTPLGGHLVSGHVDGVGTLIDRRDDARSVRLTIEAPAGLARYIAAKGSICVDGVSLTVNAVDGARFDLNIVPHTLTATTLGEYAAGRQVNLEVDIIARYLERLLLGDAAAQPDAAGVTRELLAQHGFIK
jgi:riboflavin synthase